MNALTVAATNNLAGVTSTSPPTGRFAAAKTPLANARGSDQSHDRKGVIFRKILKLTGGAVRLAAILGVELSGHSGSRVCLHRENLLAAIDQNAAQIDRIARR